MSTYSRVRESGFANGWPYQPSTTCGPETPSPRIMRPRERWSSVSACIAVDAGVDLHDRGTEPDPRSVGADPRERREGVRAPRLGGPHRVVAEPLGFLGDLDEVPVRFALPVTELHAEFEFAHVRASSTQDCT